MTTCLSFDDKAGLPNHECTLLPRRDLERSSGTPEVVGVPSGQSIHAPALETKEARAVPQRRLHHLALALLFQQG